MALNDKQERFCREYIIDVNATQAAVRAGYSEKTACQAAARLLTKVKVTEKIAELMAEIKSQKIATAAEVLETLTRVLRREELETVVMMRKTARSYYDEKGKKVTESTEEPVLVEIPTRVSDLNKAAELMGKRHSLFTEKVDLGGNVTVVFDNDYGDG